MINLYLFNNFVLPLFLVLFTLSLSLSLSLSLPSSLCMIVVSSIIVRSILHFINIDSDTIVIETVIDINQYLLL